MDKSYISIINKEYSGRQNLYLKDHKSDIFVILKLKIYPLIISFLEESEYFSTSFNHNEGVHMISSDLDQKNFEAVIGYFYGKEIKLSRNWEILKMLHVVNFLKVPPLFKKIMDDIKAGFDQYGFFLLMSIGEKFNVKWLKERCQQELILMGFEQLNFNRYDLMQVDRQIFQEIIKLHELLKINQNIMGLKQIQMKKIIKQYCKVNNICESEANKICELTVSAQANQFKIQLTDSIMRKKQEFQQKKIKKKNTIITNRIVKDEQNFQAYNIKFINSQMQEKNNSLFQEIKNVKNSIENTDKLQKFSSCQNIEQDIDQKIKMFEKLSQEQDRKFLNLKAQFQKLNEPYHNKKSQGSETQINNKNVGSSTGSSKDNDVKSQRQRKLAQSVKKINHISIMPRLSKDFQ